MKLLALAALAAVIAFACPALAADPVYELKSGPGRETPEAVKTLYLELDTIPGGTPLAFVFALIAKRHGEGLMCAVQPLEPLADVGSVGEFIRPSDGATMFIIKYLRPKGPPTYSWRQAPGNST